MVDPLERREVLSAATFSPFAVLPGVVTTAGKPAQVVLNFAAGQVTSSQSPSVLVGLYVEPAPGSTVTPQIQEVDGSDGPLARYSLPKRAGAASPQVLYLTHLDANSLAPQVLSVYVSEPGKQVGNFTLEAFLPGDANADGSVDATDLALVHAAYGTKLGDPTNDPAADFNADGHVGCIDLTLTTLNQGAHIGLAPAAAVAAASLVPVPVAVPVAVAVPVPVSIGQPIIQAPTYVQSSAIAPSYFPGQQVGTSPTPQGPTGDPGSEYVQSLYGAVLGREGTTGEVASWVAKLASGATPAMVADGFVNSLEHRGDEVASYYEEFLHRAPDPASLAWVDDLLAGASEEDVVTAILDSPEYQAAHATPDQLVQGLYADVLGRQGDPAGVAYWDAALASGETRAAVVAGFVNSNEAVDRVVASFYANDLHRYPEIGTSNPWVALLETPGGSASDVAVGILSSPEFIRGVKLA